MRHDKALRASGRYSLVIAKKKGLPPSGSTIGNSAVTIRNRFFAASSIVDGSLYGRVRGEPAIVLRGKTSGVPKRQGQGSISYTIS
jgi:hypothetical protein